MDSSVVVYITVIDNCRPKGYELHGRNGLFLREVKINQIVRDGVTIYD